MSEIYISKATLETIEKFGRADLTHIATSKVLDTDVELRLAEAPNVIAEKMIVAAHYAQMFSDIRDIVATCADLNARAPYRHIEAQRLLPILDGFLGEGYTGRVMELRRALGLTTKD
ncbi:hypothetical protein [Caballeronia sp. KNU42]